ncbi:MAG: HD domain-containing protein [Bacteroidota bacterium]
MPNQTAIQRYQSIIRPENVIEEQIILHPEWQEGVSWGKPRKGHPEGQVILHIREVLDNVDQLTLSVKDREKLRWITLIHDSFKYKEEFGFPRDWSKHHAVFARQFAEQLIDDPAVLDIIELHDEAYYAWRAQARFSLWSSSAKRLELLENRIGTNMNLFYWFFVCDTQTGNKTQAPIEWFEHQYPQLDPIPWTNQ